MKSKIFLLIAACFTCVVGLGSDSIKILYPNGGEILKTNTVIRVRWSSTKPNEPNKPNTPKGKVILILYKKGIKHSVISKGADNNGLFMWKIPRKIPEGNDYRVRIRLLDNLSVNDFSDRDFTIKKST
jgi:hypothetical protein